MKVPPAPSTGRATGRRTESPHTVPLIAALWATIVGVYLFIAATSHRSFVVITSAPPSTYEVVKHKLLAYASFVAVTDFNSAFGLFIPALLALWPLAFQEYRRVALLIAGALTFGICVVWPFSIGLLYLPTAMLLLSAAARA